MPLQKVTKDIALGAKGLNLKGDPQLVPDDALLQATNVQYNVDGSVSTRYGYSTVSNPLSTYGKNQGIPTALFVTKEGNIGVCGTQGATRGGLASITTNDPALQPTPATTVNLPTPYDSNGALMAPQHVTWAQWTATDSNPRWTICWDYQDSGTTNWISYWAVWNPTTNAWDAAPAAIGNFGYTSGTYGAVTTLGVATPLALPMQGIAVAANFFSGGHNQTQVVFIGIKGDATGGATSFSLSSTIIPFDHITGPAAPSSYPAAAIDCSQIGYDGYQVAIVGTMVGASNAAVYGASTTWNGSAWASTCTFVVNPTGLTGSSLITCSVDVTSSPQLFVCDGTNWARLSSAGANTASGTQTLSSLTVTSVIVGTNGSSWTLSVAQRGTSTQNGAIFTKSVSFSVGSGAISGGSNGASQFSIGTTKFISKPFFSGGTNQAYAWLIPDTSVSSTTPTTVAPQQTFVCMNLATGAVIGRASYLAANVNVGTPCNVMGAGIPPTPTSAMSFVFPTLGNYLQANNRSGGTNAAPTFINAPALTLISATFGATSTVELPYGTLTSGMAPQLITNQTNYEDGFSWFPGISVSSYSAGNLTGTYNYAAVWYWLDDFNIPHYSRPYFLTGLTPSSQRIVFGWSGNFGGAYNGPLYGPPSGKGSLFLYRTTNGGSVYYALGNMAANTTGSIFPDLLFTDNVTDANLIANANVTLYTTSGELAHDPPPAFTIVAATTQYAFGVSAENPAQLYVSLPFRSGYALSWNAAQYMLVDPSSGPITALQAMDDKLLVFKANKVFVIYGNGYDVTGQNADLSFTTPQLLATSQGCVAAQSVVLTDIGVFFQSPRGIELIDRGLQEQYIGLLLDGQVGTVQGACFVRSLGQVRFWDSTGSVFWVYDLNVQKWSQFSNTSLFGVSGYPCPLTATGTSMYAGVKQSVLGSTPAPIVYETVGAYTDTTSPVGFNEMACTVQTGWIKLTGLQGFGRLYRFICALTASSSAGVTLTVQVAYDFNTTVVDSFTLTNPASSGYNQFRARCSHQKAEAVQFTFSWTVTNGVALPLRLSALSLELGAKEGIYKLNAGQTLG